MTTLPSEREALEKALAALNATNNAKRIQDFADADRLRIDAIKALTAAPCIAPIRAAYWNSGGCDLRKEWRLCSG